MKKIILSLALLVATMFAGDYTDECKSLDKKYHNAGKTLMTTFDGKTRSDALKVLIETRDAKVALDCRCHLKCPTFKSWK